MSFRNIVSSLLLNLFPKSNGHKPANVAVPIEPLLTQSNSRKFSYVVLARPLSPLLQRLTLPMMPRDLSLGDTANFVLDVIRQNIAEGKLLNKKMISGRVLNAISRHYGADLSNYGLFRKIPENPSMLELRKAKVTKYVGAY